MRPDSEREADPSGEPQPRGELAARTLAMPADTNPGGDIFGGWIMSLMDSAGAITATRQAEGRVATAAVGNISFLQPVKVGDVVCCYTEIVGIGRTSMKLGVEVWVLRQGCGPRIKVTAAEFTFVALDKAGRPRPLAGPGGSATSPAGPPPAAASL
jgi:acyl-CoA thioesterase YciA